MHKEFDSNEIKCKVTTFLPERTEKWRPANNILLMALILPSKGIFERP